MTQIWLGSAYNYIMNLITRFSMFTVLMPALISTANGADARLQERNFMIEEIRFISEGDAKRGGLPPIGKRVLQAMSKVPRHEFVPEKYQSLAYENMPLSIGEGQTISQPYIVALMSNLSQVDSDSVVLEIGTGSGYQAAILGELTSQVYTIEIIPALGKNAKKTLKRLNYNNVSVKIGDGYAGWPEHAPFDAIVVTAAPETVPQPLIDQLKVGGRMVIPVGPQESSQTLQVLTKNEDGKLSTLDIIPVLFVPFTRDDED